MNNPSAHSNTSTTLSDVVATLTRLGCQPTSSSTGYSAYCPVHETDGNRHTKSLTLREGDRVPVIVHCHAGCESKTILQAVGIEAPSRRTVNIPTGYSYRDADGHEVRQKLRYEPKEFRICHKEAGRHIYKYGPGPHVLYRLPEVVAAIQSRNTIFLLEGEKDVDRAVREGLIATTNIEGASQPGQNSKWRRDYTVQLTGATCIVLLPDNDPAGRAHMAHIGQQLIGRVQETILIDLGRLYPDLPEKGDLSDWLNMGHTVEELLELVGKASPLRQPHESTPAPLLADAVDDESDEVTDEAAKITADSAEILRLAELNLLDYDRQRGTAAKALGIRGETLDKLVKEQRGDKEDSSSGKTLCFPEITPHPQPVSGAELLNELTSSVRRFVCLPEHAAPAIALWVVYSYIVIQHGHIAPTLAITSPEKRCGKSTLLTWLYRVVAKPLLAANITTAAIFRTIDAWQPTLLIDEADSFLGESGDELRGILNSGHTRETAYVIRVVGDEHEPRKFSTWGAKAVALIGKLEGKYSTLADRSIEIQLRRRMATDKIEKLRHADIKHFQTLSARCLRFAIDHSETIGKAKPELPELHDRAADNWEPLLAIADMAGSHYPRLARTVALALSGGEVDTGTESSGSFGVQLLTDLHRFFSERTADSYPTTQLLTYLTGIDDAPWATFAKGKAMTPRHLSRLLQPYGIKSKNLWQAGAVAKGYEVADFRDAFARYLPSIRYAARSTSSTGKSPDCVSAMNSKPSGYETASSVSQIAVHSGIADKKPENPLAEGSVWNSEAGAWEPTPFPVDNFPQPQPPTPERNCTVYPNRYC